MKIMGIKITDIITAKKKLGRFESKKSSEVTLTLLSRELQEKAMVVITAKIAE